MTVDKITQTIDHALLAPTMSDAQVLEGCKLADSLGVATVCVKPCHVSLAANALSASRVGVGTVIGFPHGSNTMAIKVAEARQALADGAVELDMVINTGKALEGKWGEVESDIAAVVEAGHTAGALVKVIFETDYVNGESDVIRLCEICTSVSADFVKTSTGFGFTKNVSGDYNYVGATEAAIKMMKASVGPNVGVKASGGIRDFESARKFVELGCTRLGTSASAAIAAGAGTDQQSY